MDLNALRHAKARLQKAEQAAEALQAAKTFDETESSWTDFLLAASAIYSKLGEGAKANGKSTAWFGRIKKLRKDDELLSYMHHARNSDEHGIRDTTHRKAVGAEFVWPDGTKSVLRVEDPNVQLIETETGGTPINRIIRYTDLVRVYDTRYGDHFDPPTSHLGKSVETKNPVEISQLAIIYLRALLEEAEGL